MADRPPTLLEMAMRVTIAQEKLQATLNDLRVAEGEWTSFTLIGTDMADGAYSTLRTTWGLINRMNDIAQERLVEAKKGKK